MADEDEAVLLKEASYNAAIIIDISRRYGDEYLFAICLAINRDLDAIIRAPPEAKIRRAYKTKKTLPARKRLVEHTTQLNTHVEGRYSNIEFKCIGDFEKCQAKRGKYSSLCVLAFFICLARRLIPLVEQAEKS